MEESRMETNGKNKVFHDLLADYQFESAKKEDASGYVIIYRDPEDDAIVLMGRGSKETYNALLENVREFAKEVKFSYHGTAKDQDYTLMELAEMSRDVHGRPFLQVVNQLNGLVNKLTEEIQ